MNRITTLFLTVLAPLLALLMAWLGWLASRTNLLGWFLVVAGLGFALGVLVKFWILKIPYWNPASGEAAVSEEKGDRSFWLIIPGLGLPMFASPLEYLLAGPVIPRSASLAYLGAAVVILAMLLFGEARRKLRASYAGHLTVTAGQQLVQSGPYRLVRHPAYLAFLLMAVGFAVGFSSLVGLAAVPILLLPGLVNRIKVEEAMLAKHFNGEWDRYAARTRRLIPGLW